MTKESILGILTSAFWGVGRGGFSFFIFFFFNIKMLKPGSKSGLPLLLHSLCPGLHKPSFTLVFFAFALTLSFDSTNQYEEMHIPY